MTEPLPFRPARAEIVVVAGPRGSGKSTLARTLIASAPRVLIFDPLGEHQGGKVLGFEETLDWIGRAGRAARYRVIARVQSDEADDLLRASWSMLPAVLCIDEADLLRETSGSPTPGLRYMIEYGRHAGHAVVAVTRRPFALPRAVTASATHVACFRCWEPRDLSFWRQCLPHGALDLMSRLPEYGFVHADLRRGEVRAVAPIPAESGLSPETPETTEAETSGERPPAGSEPD